MKKSKAYLVEEVNVPVELRIRVIRYNEKREEVDIPFYVIVGEGEFTVVLNERKKNVG